MIQRFSSSHLQGFKYEDLRNSPGWWATTVATYCQRRPSQLSQNNLPIHDQQVDENLCSLMARRHHFYIFFECFHIIPSLLRHWHRQDNITEKMQQASEAQADECNKKSLFNLFSIFTESQLTRKAPASYSDGVYTMTGDQRPSPRTISQALMKGSDGLASRRNRTALHTFFGKWLR